VQHTPKQSVKYWSNAIVKNSTRLSCDTSMSSD